MVRLLLVLAFGLGLAAFSPGVAQAEGTGEVLTGTVQTSRSGPIEDVQIEVTTSDGQEIESVETDAEGRWEVELPGPGEYVVTLDEGDLPDTVELSNTNTRTVTVDEGRRQAVIIGLEDGSRGAGGGGIRAVQLLVDGIRFGLLIAMAAVGLSLIFGTTGLTNFAHGEIVTFGALAAWYVNVTMGLHFFPATVIAVIIGGIAGALQDRVVWRPLRSRGTGLIAMLVISIGLSLLVRYIFLYQFGGRTRPYAQYAVQRAWSVGPVDIAPKTFWSIVASLVVLFLVGLGLQRTRLGKAMRAVADNGDLASASGIDTQRVIMLVWVFGGALAAFGGVLQGLNQQVSWQVGFQLLLLMFAGVTLGGLGTAYGALVGSLVVGVFISVSTIWIADELKNVGALLILILVLLVRPQGILGRAERVG